MKLILIKIFFRLLSVLMLTSIASLALVYYLLSSERGANYILNYAGNYLTDNYSLTIDFDSATGNLSEGLVFNQLNLQHPLFSLQAQVLESTWSFWSLFNKELNLQTLQINRLVLRQITASNNEQEQDNNLASGIEKIFSLPISITIETLELISPEIVFDQQNVSFSNLSARLALDNQAFQINNFSLIDNDYTLAGAVTLRSSDYLMDGNLDWTYQNAAAQAAANSPYSGSLFFSGDINDLDISHNLMQPLQVVSNGTLSNGLLEGIGLSFSFEHAVDDVIDFLALPEMLTSIEGTVLTHGSPELVFIDADFALQTLDFLPINLLLSGEYQNQSLSFETISVISPEIDLQLVADFNLESLSLEADWRLNNLAPDDYLEAFNLQNVNGGGSLSASANGNAELNLSFLTGRLNGYLLEANGQIELDENNLSSIDLQLNTGRNRIALEGRIDDQLDINWVINAPDLSLWLPALSGNIAGNGLVNGVLNNPKISGLLQVNSLEYLDQGTRVQLENLEASILTQQDNYQFNISLLGLITEINDNELQVSDSRINFNGNLSDHVGDMTLNGDNLDLEIDFAGSFLNDTWQGNIFNAIVNSDYGFWQLQNNMGLNLSTSSLNLAQHCWAYIETSLCLNANINEEEILLNTNITAFPLTYLNTASIIEQVDNSVLNRIFSEKPHALSELQDDFAAYLPDNSYIQGELNAQLELRATANSLQEVDFTLNLQPENLELSLYLPQENEVQSVQPETRTFLIEPDILMLSSNSGTISTLVDLIIYHQETSGLDVQGDLNIQLDMDRERNLQGIMTLDFPNLDWLETLLPEIRNTRGELTGQLQLLGAVEQPKFVSDLTLSNGSFEIPEYGISPQQVYIELMSDDEQNLQVTASAISGNGNLNFIGEAASLYSSERIFELTLSGDNFELINNAGTHMLASPDLRLNFQEGILDIRGKVTIPELDIDIREASTILLNNGIDVSRDVVIINAPPEQANLLNSNQSDFMEIPVTANLELELGNNVHFQGLGLDLMLSGNLQAQQDLDRPLVAYGDISIAEGFYEIYGQRLDVTNGKMIFFGNILNPALDIRAYRQDSSIQAGVQINGTLRNMQSQLFSTPSLPESEILSILITGKSYADTDNQEQNNILGAVASLGINRGSGITRAIRSELGLDTLELNSQSNLDQSSLGLGKYLTPDIFMHYEIGLFERESTLSLDYILSERLRLEVESGISQSIDMTFTVEK